MINIELKSKEDLKRFKNRLRTVCEKRGVRLGKAEHKLNDIVTEFLEYTDYNALVSQVQKQKNKLSDTTLEISSLSLFPERVSVPSTTYGAQERILNSLRSARNIQSVIFAVRDGNPNDHALTLIVIAESGIKVFDTTNITAERTPRELELLDIFRALKDLGCLKKTRFIKQRIKATYELPILKAFDELTTYPLEEIFHEWRRFISCFTSSPAIPSPGVFLDEDWNELANSYTEEK